MSIDDGVYLGYAIPSRSRAPHSSADHLGIEHERRGWASNYSATNVGDVKACSKHPVVKENHVLGTVAAEVLKYGAAVFYGSVGCDYTGIYMFGI